MKTELVQTLTSTFEAHAQQTETGVEYWLARDLQFLLGYTKWDNFLNVISKARTASEVSGHRVADHFADVGKMVDLGSGSQRQIEDIMLTRYAATSSLKTAIPRSRRLRLRRPTSPSRPAAPKSSNNASSKPSASLPGTSSVTRETPMSASPRPRAGVPSVLVFDGYLMGRGCASCQPLQKSLDTMTPNQPNFVKSSARQKSAKWCTHLHLRGFSFDTDGGKSAVICSLDWSMVRA